MHTTCTILILICITAIIDNQAYLRPRNHTAPSGRSTAPVPVSDHRNHMPARQTTKPQELSQGTSQNPATFHLLSLSARRFDNAKVLVNKLCSLKMAKGTNTAINAKLISNKLAATRSKRVKNNLKASNNLLCHVENEKKSETKRRR